MKEKLLETVNDIYQEVFMTDMTALNYLASRGITAQTAKAFEVGYSSSYCLSPLKVTNQSELEYLGLLNEKGNERNWSRVMFPIRDEDGELKGFNGRSLKSDDAIKYLLSPEEMGFEKSKLLYNLHQAKDSIHEKDHVFFVEGVIDVMAMYQMGIKNVVCGLGTSLTNQQIDKISQYTKNFVFAYDGDAAGFKASVKNARALAARLNQADSSFRGDAQIKFLTLPKGMDPADFIKKPHTFRTILKEAKAYYDYCSSTCKQHPEYEQVFVEIQKTQQIQREILSISKSRTKEALKNVDIVEVVSGYLNLKKSGQNFVCHCPFHNEKSESFVVSPGKQIFKCFGCGEGGNALKFVAQIEGISYQEAMNQLSGSMNKKERVRNETRRKHTPAQPVLER